MRNSDLIHIILILIQLFSLIADIANAMSAEKIINEWKKKNFKPIYWLEGEEDYYIDQVMQYAGHKILSESE